MIKNLVEYFEPNQEVALESLEYRRKDVTNKETNFSLSCNDNMDFSLSEDGTFLRIILSREINCDPDELFQLSISFSAVLKFNERMNEIKWKNENLAKEFIENGDFVVNALMSRASMLIAQVTSASGQSPIILPPNIIKSENK